MKYFPLLATVFLTYSEPSLSSSNCYWNSGCPYRYFSSKTPYNFIRGDIRDSAIRRKGCEPISIWGIYNHGKVQPSKNFANNIKYALKIKEYLQASYAAGRSSLCSQDVQNLLNWKMDDKIFKESNHITEEGLKDMEELSYRLKEAFLKLLGNLKEEDYMFRPILDASTETSMQAFIKGFQDLKLTYIKSKLEFDDLAPFSTCNNYLQEIKNNTKLYLEAVKYEHNPEYLVAKDRIQRRSGIEYILNDDNITALYDLCRYNSSGFDNKISPWCAFFTTDDLIVLEYKGDLMEYYKSGYGYPNAKDFGAIPLKDLLTKFKEAKQGKGKKIVVYITHAAMMDMIYTSLGLFKDDAPLTGTHRNPNRNWRTAKISTFSANLVAVLYRCDMKNSSEHNVVFYLNEEPLISACKEGVCSWQEFEEKLTFTNSTLDFCDRQTY